MTTYNYFNDIENVIDPVFESISPPVDAPHVSSIFEAGPSEGSRIGDLGGMQMRSQAMAAVLTWVDDGDLTIEALEAIAQGLADVDGDGELDDDEAADLEELFDGIAAAFVALGANQDNVDAFLGDGDNEECDKLGEFLATKLDGIDADDETLVSRFAARDQLVAEAMKKVVRGGKVKWIKKRTRKVRLTAAQRAGLKKARRKANTGAARLARKKAMKIRKQKGL